MLARKADRKTNRELTLLYYRLAKAADQLGDNEKALKYYKQAYDLDSTYLPTLLDRAGAAVPPRALGRRVPHLPDHPGPPPRHPEGRSTSSTSSSASGRIKLKLGERTKAINMFEKALEIQPGHRADPGGADRPLHRRRRLGGGDQAEAGAADRARDDADEKFALSASRSSRSTRSKLNNPQKAIAAYLEALELKPGDRQLLHDLLDLFSETKQWKKAMEILMKLAELDSGKGKARFLDRGGQHRQLRAALHRRGGGAVQPGAWTRTRTT